MRTRKSLSFLAAGAAVTIAAGIGTLSFGADKANGDTGRVSGSITYTGKVPAAKALEITKDTAICGKDPKYDESLVVGAKKGLANVVIVLEGAKKGTVTAGAATIDQQGCRYVPHVQVATVGSTLTVKNGDETLHTVHAYQDSATLFNDVTATKGAKATEKLEDAGPVSFKCDAGHTWMSAWVYVVDQPYYAITDANGNFSIAGIPPGTYTVKAWHEKLGARTAKVTIAKDKEAKVSLKYK